MSRTEEIRAIAADLFERKGYSATTMADIADAANVLPGSLYHHFPSKAALALEILESLDRHLESVGVAMQDQVAESPEDRLERLVREVIEVSFENSGAIRLRGYDAPTIATDQLENALKAHAPAFERAWKRAIDALPTRSRRSPTDLALTRFAFRSLALGASLLHPATAHTSDLARQMREILLHGIALDCPDDDALDRSEATDAVVDAMASWPAATAPDNVTDVRESIVAAARTEFARRGYDATTIRDIAGAAGVTMGTLYRRIESKEAVLHEVIDAYSSSLDKAIRAALTTGTSSIESIDALARVMVRARNRFREESDILKFGWNDRTDPGSPIHEYYEQTEERLAILAASLKKGIAHGTVRDVAKPAVLATHIRHVVWLPFRDYNRTSEARALAFVRSSLLRGLLNDGN